MSKNTKEEYFVSQLQDIQFDETLSNYVNYTPIVDIVESIIGPNITAVHGMVINKPPGGSKERSIHPLHQDQYYFPVYPHNSMVTSWTALEHIDDKNGCLFVVPGSHKNGLYPHGYSKLGVNKFYHEVDNPLAGPMVRLHMEKGDTVFFHCLLLHGSGPNVTTGFRKAIACVYVDSNVNFLDVRGTIQDEIGVKAEHSARFQFGTKLSFADAWKAKARLVRGSPGNFQKLSTKL